MEVTVQTTERVSKDLERKRPQLAATRELQSVLDEYGAALTPLHAGASDAELAKQFTTNVQNEQAAEELCQRLTELAAVEAAYPKAPGSAPS